MTSKYKLGIALSGGGARGIAHIGVLAALEEHYIVPEVISGTSAGSIVGALYASGLRPAEILEAFKESSLFKTINVGLPIAGLTNLNYLKERLAEFIKEDSFEALHKPLFVAISNLNKGEEEIVCTGPLFDVVVASSSIPLVFKPVMINNQTYVDGGLLRNLPAEPVKELCDLVIGVNVMPHVQVSNKKVDSMVDIAFRGFDLTIWNNSQLDLAVCDVLIEPLALLDYTILSFHKAEEIYEIGYLETLSKMSKIEQLIEDMQSSDVE